jgi:hypothetical protein
VYTYNGREISHGKKEDQMIIKFTLEKTKYIGIDLIVYEDGIFALIAANGYEQGYNHRPYDREIEEFRNEAVVA